MKRFLFVTGALLVAALGCDREPCAVCTEEFQARHVSLALAGCALPTKSSDSQSPEESWVAESVLYVFSRTGALVDSYASTEGRFDFYLTDELYDFVVVANRTDLPRTEVSEETLSALPVRLADNAVGNFQMAGSLAKHLIEADEKITVEVSHLPDQCFRRKRPGPFALCTGVGCAVVQPDGSRQSAAAGLSGPLAAGASGPADGCF